MKRCIWCNKSEKNETFEKIAHIVPKSLGGKQICENVCDSCNHYFGSHKSGTPPIEVVFKETFNITRARLLGDDQIGKNKPLARFTSEFFNINFQKRSIDLKPKFKLRPGYQSKLCRQFRRGIYKSFLEENERVNSNSHDDRYDFIREFARYDLGDYPVLYFRRKIPAILIGMNDVRAPQFHLESAFKYEIKDGSFFEVDFLSHFFSFPITRNYVFNLENYIRDSISLKEKFYYKPVVLEYLNQIDLILDILND